MKIKIDKCRLQVDYKTKYGNHVSVSPIQPPHNGHLLSLDDFPRVKEILVSPILFVVREALAERNSLRSLRSASCSNNNNSNSITSRKITEYGQRQVTMYRGGCHGHRDFRYLRAPSCLRYDFSLKNIQPKNGVKRQKCRILTK